MRGDPRLSDRGVDDRQDTFHVCPCGNLGNHSAEPLMKFILRGDTVTQDGAIVIDDGRRRFIASRFDRQDGHGDSQEVVRIGGRAVSPRDFPNPTINRLSQHLLHHFTMHIGQAEWPSVMHER